MNKLEQLTPKEVWAEFEKICTIPHGSTNTKEISDYCVSVAKECGLKYRQDSDNNVIIWKDGTPGYEVDPAIILQGHIDMVCVKEPDCTKDLDKDGLDLIVEEDWLSAEKTSLGGDDGIAVAMSLALLRSKELSHPPLVVILTVDEEIGMLGADSIDVSDVKANRMLNIDNEAEGEFLISCAGGATVTCHFPIEWTEAQGRAYTLEFTGLLGGHSGEGIIHQRINANTLFGRFLLEAPFEIAIHSMNGGEKDNAIAKIFHSVLVVSEDQAKELEEYVDRFEKIIQEEYVLIDPGFCVILKEAQKVDRVFTDETRSNCIHALTHLPSDIQRMMPGMKDMVETSLNLGILQTTETEVTYTYSVRSSIQSRKEYLIRQMKDMTELCGGTITITGVYPAWEYKKESPFREHLISVYRNLYGTEPILAAIHAGVECGIFSSKIPNLDCVAIGPDMEDIHTTNEKLSIPSVERTWKFITEVLKQHI